MSNKKNISAIYPLSPMQQGMLFHSLYAPESGVYIEQMSMDLTGDINIAAFEAAWQKVVDRYSILRTFFVWKNRENPLQIVLKQVLIPWHNLDWRELPTIEQEQQLKQLLLSQRQKGFDFNQAPLMNCTIIRLGDENYKFIWNHHHILIDGWCLSIIFKEVLSFYEAQLQGVSCQLPTPRPYSDYIDWLNSQNKSTAIEFWQQYLQGFTAPTPLVVDKTISQSQQHSRDYDQIACVCSTDCSQKLEKIAQQHHLTLSTIVQAAWALLLSRYSHESDVVFGVTVSGRPPDLPGVEDMVGLFINTLPLRVKVPKSSNLISWLQEIQQSMVELQQYSYTPLFDIQAICEVRGGISLFESIVVFDNYPVDSSLLNEECSLLVSNIEDFERTNYPLSIAVVAGSQLSLSINYDTTRFDKDTIERMAAHLNNLFEAIAQNPVANVDTFNLLCESERHQLLVEWNDTTTDYPKDKCIHQLFEEQVEKTPDAIAVVFEQEQLTYQQLNQRANQLAHHLQTLGVKPEVLVGVCVERSIEMVVGLLGILKAGGAYVPLDPNYPQERLSYMLEDSAVGVLITQSSLLEFLPQHNARVICLDSERDQIEQYSQENLDVGVDSNNLAYVIYTSGSTGKPKGISVVHQGVNRLVINVNYINLQPKDVIAFASNFSFDAATFEIWGTLLNGAKLVGVNKDVVLSPRNFADFIQEQKISTLFLTTALFNQIANVVPNAFYGMKQVMFGGETVDIKSVKEVLKEPPKRLLHVYGPTESTTFTTWYCVSNVQEDTITIPIGCPISNTQTYILDSHLQPVPVGVPGELHIGGDGLARGYLNRPQLTSEKFILNPFSNSKSERLYKTGDLARYLSDGSIEFLGRIDHQVKIRGFRIELGEIEAALTTHPEVNQAVVIALKENTGNKRLVAYVVINSVNKTQQLREYLKAQLPDYMVPSAFVTLESLPLTPNGKVDRKALPAPEIERETEYIAPRTQSEEIIANIFAQVLNLENIGIHDNFFILGGHSLLATQLISRVRSAFSIEIPLGELFSSPTVAQLDQTIIQLRNTNNGLTLPPIQPRTETKQLPLSWAQERLWFLNQLEGKSATYNIPAAVRISGKLDINALQQALSSIVKRHEVLRTSFQIENGKPIQVIDPEATVNIIEVDLQQLETTKRENLVIEQVQLEATTPFYLENAPLIRCSLLQLSTWEYVLLVTMHHIVSDGWSMGVFIQELSSLYQTFIGGEALPLEKLPIQYADFALWQRQYLSGQVLSTQLDYWKQQLSGAPDLLQLPTDYPRPTVQTYQGRTISLNLNTDLTTKLQKLSRESGTTLFMTLYAAFSTLLYRYSGQSDIAVGSPIANRNRSEIEGLIGFFVNTLVLRTRFEDNPSFKKLLAQVRETTLKAYENQDVPFEKVVEVLQPQRSLSHSPLFQVMFILQNAPMTDVELPGVSLSSIELESTIAKFDLTLSMTETDQGLVGEWEYNTDLFNQSTIERMAAHFHNLLEAIVENPKQNVGTFNLLSDSERDQLLVKWNDTATVYPQNKCIHQLFEQQVEKTPDAVAVVFESEQLTYEQLNQRANQLARHLQTLGVKPEVLVGICVERSIEMVVGLLGILKAGGAYVPLDPNYPQERLSYMLEDSAVGVLITQSQLLKSLPQNNAQILCLDNDWGVIEKESQSNLNVGVTDHNLAYVIYTSGSTGKPKGVLVEHQALVNHMSWMQSCFPLQKNDKVIHKTPFSFDASVWEFYAPLFVGAQLVIAKPGGHKDSNYLVDEISRLKITTIQIVPSLLRMLLETPGIEKCQSLKQVFCGGEILPVEVVEDFKKKLNAQLNNIYGPSEATIDTTVFKCEEKFYQSTIPIGRPISNVQTYILDSHLKPVPVGVPGELYIGGDGLARGYLNRPQLTSEKFIQNPFDKSKSQRLYKTGDLVRYLSDGNIEFLGRIDNQVKIRGFRIELGEIEAVLTTHAQVNQAVVIALEENTGSKRLVAYVVANSEIKTQQLREYLKSQLPDYMVPSAFVTLDSLPLTPNGKVDRKALPAPETERENEYIAPRTEVEQILTNIFAQVLNLENIGTHDNFFDLGGHSLLAVHLMSEIHKQFGKNLPLATLFQNPTVEQLAFVLSSNLSSQLWETLVAVQPKGSLPPLFCVPGAGGNVLYFYHLARYLGNNQPLYGLQAQGLDGETEPYKSIEEIAQQNIKAIQTVQPTGPYFLTGHSFGSRVVFEMTIQLQRMGESVAYVGILDTPAPIKSGNDEDEFSNWDDAKWLCELAKILEAIMGTNLVLDYQTLVSLTPEQQFKHFKEHLEMIGFFPPQTDIKIARGLVQVHQIQCQIGYEPQNTFSAPITLFCAMEIDLEAQNSSTLYQEPTWGWNKFSNSEVEVHIVPGNHVSMMSEPHVKVLAEKLQQSLQKAQNLQKIHGKTTN